MTISSAVLDIWSNQGATATPKALREKISKKLTGDKSKITYKHSLEIYLQGSYRNNTNIYGNSDVDIVVQSDWSFFTDISQLDSFEKSIHNESFSNSSYKWEDFKREIVGTLEDAFGKSKVEIGNKSIKINDGSYEADVVPCFEYRKYTKFGKEESEREYIAGIKFFTNNENREVINYPKEHYTKGVNKNQRVNMLYKPTIRIFKNIKRRLIENKMISKEEVSSYFIENLLYNVPDKFYREKDTSKRVFGVISWLNDNMNNLSDFECQNEQIKLFGYSPEQWNETDARKFINRLIKYWNDWDNA